MSVPIGTFLAALHRIVSPQKAADWDLSGLVLGDPAATIDTVGICHEVTEAVVAAVEADPMDLLVTYHPSLFRPTNRLLAGPTPAGRTLRLARAGVALAVAHTSFDAADGGTADALAHALGLTDTTGFAPVVPAGQVSVVTYVPPEAVERVAAAMSEAGAGVIGNYTGCSFRTEGTGAFTPEAGSEPLTGVVGVDSREREVRIEMIAPAHATDRVAAALRAAHPYDEPPFNVTDVRANLGFIGRVGRFGGSLDDLVARVGATLGTAGLRVSRGGDLAGRVAVVPGSGGSFVAAAAGVGADVVVTGDVGHHQVREAVDRRVTIIDPGHAPSERPGMAVLAGLVAAVGGEAGVDAVDLTSLDPTPWR